MMNEYKGIINKSIVSSYNEALIIDIVDDKVFKYQINNGDIVMDKEISYIEYLNDCKKFIFLDDVDNYVESLSLSRLEN